MPPVTRLLIACWAAAAAGELFAQSGLPPQYPAPAARLDLEAGQQSFARQYLAVPRDETSAEESGVPAPPARQIEDHGPSVYLAPTTPANDHEPLPQPNSGQSDVSGGYERSVYEPPFEAANAPSGNAPDMPDSGITAASFEEEAGVKPQLLPPPLVPPRPAPVGSTAPRRTTEAADGAAGQVWPATHTAEGASLPAETEGPGNETAANELPATEPPTAATLPLAPAHEPLPLEPPGGASANGRDRSASGLPSMATAIGGLAIVLGIFFVVAWGMRRTTPGTLTTLPNQVVEVLGRAPLSGRQQVHLLRCGNKLVLVSVTPEGAETLTEITDPFEVDRLAGLCEAARPSSSSAAFRRVFQQFAHEGRATHAT